jgi:hypothetical protein
METEAINQQLDVFKVGSSSLLPKVVIKRS